MATYLPAINVSAGRQPSYSFPHQNEPDRIVKVDNKRMKVAGPVKVTVRKLMNKKEQQLEERRFASRGKLPELDERQTAEFQNSYKHTMCIEMLERGFHHSFTEIFGLIKLQADRRRIAGPDSSLWNEKLLEEEHEKLDVMKQHLVDAESAMLLGDYVRVYQSHHQLAEYFQSTGDKWLADHFFQNCLHYSNCVSDGKGKVAADGHCNVGISLEESGNLNEAAYNFELCYALTKDKSDWVLEDGRTPMHCQSCNHLMRIYTSIARHCQAENDNESGLKYLSRAYEMAKEGGDKKLFGEASYQLGSAYIQNGDPETALMHLHNYLETCQGLKDSEGIGKACEAIAKAHESQGHVEESIKYLMKFIRVSEDSKDDKSLSVACNSLGIRYNCLGQYKRAFDNFSRSYNISRTLNNTPMLHLSRVLCGTAHAHEMLHNYTRHVKSAPSSRPAIARLLDWKDNRGDEFDIPLTIPAASAPSTSGQSQPIRSEKNERKEEAIPELEEQETEDVGSTETTENTAS